MNLTKKVFWIWVGIGIGTGIAECHIPLFSMGMSIIGLTCIVGSIAYYGKPLITD